MAMVAYRHDYVGLDDGRHGHGFDALSALAGNVLFLLFQSQRNNPGLDIFRTGSFREPPAFFPVTGIGPMPFG